MTQEHDHGSSNRPATPPGKPEDGWSFVAFESVESLFERLMSLLAQFPWFFAIASILAVVGAHWLAYETLLLYQRVAYPLLIALAAILALLGAAVWVYNQRFRPHAERTWPMVAAVCAILYFLDLASLAIHKALPSVLLAPLFLAALVVFVAAANAKRESLIRVRALRVFRWSEIDAARRDAAGSTPRRKVQTIRPATHLIALFSPPSIVPDIGSDPDSISFEDAGKTRVTLERGMNIRDAIQSLASLQQPRLNWQHLLRAFEPHLDTLESVILMGSGSETNIRQKSSPGPLSFPDQGAHGSALYSQECEALLRMFLRDGTRIEREQHGLDFQDVERLFEWLAERVEQIHKRNPHARVVIETTGAMKTTSVAGAVATLNTPAMFQYVVTNDPYPVLLHDLRIEEPPEV